MTEEPETSREAEAIECLRFLWEKLPTDPFGDFGKRIRKLLGDE